MALTSVSHRYLGSKVNCRDEKPALLQPKLKNSSLQTLGFGSSLCLLLSVPQNLKLKPNLTDTCGHPSLTLSKKLPLKGKVKDNSHPSFNFTDISPMLSKCPKHCADTNCGETEVSGLQNTFILCLPNCIISSLSLGTSHSTSGVRRQGHFCLSAHPLHRGRGA